MDKGERVLHTDDIVAVALAVLVIAVVVSVGKSVLDSVNVNCMNETCFADCQARSETQGFNASEPHCWCVDECNACTVGYADFRNTGFLGRWFE